MIVLVGRMVSREREKVSDEKKKQTLTKQSMRQIELSISVSVVYDYSPASADYYSPVRVRRDEWCTQDQK